MDLMDTVIDVESMNENLVKDHCPVQIKLKEF